MQCLDNLPFQLVHMRGEQTGKLASAEIDHGPLCFRKILQPPTALAFVRKMRTGVEQPGEIPQNPAPVTLHRDHALASTFLGGLGIVVRQPVQQAGLKLFERSVVSHNALPRA